MNDIVFYALLATLGTWFVTAPVSYTHLDVYKRQVHKAYTQLNLVRDEERPAFFKHKTGKAADEEDPEEFCEVHAERERAVFRVFECSFIFIAVALPAFGGALFALFRRDAVRF